MNKYLGNSLISTGNRTFKHYIVRDKCKSKLVCWIDKRCSICGRFLKKENKNEKCSNCFKDSIKIRKEKYNKQYYQKNKEKWKFYYSIKKFSLNIVV